MALLTWDEKYSVGVKALDGQHTKLWGLDCDSARAAADRGRARTGVVVRG